jgi:predicted nuclease of predicted toxin-antitoxin system
MNFLVDENMPRSLAPQIVSLGFLVQDVRDISLRARPDDEVMEAAIATDAIIITRDRGFANPKTWPTEFTAGMIFVDLPSNTPTKIVNDRVIELIAKRLPTSLLGAITTVEPYRALSQIVRRRPKRT